MKYDNLKKIGFASIIGASLQLSAYANNANNTDIDKVLGELTSQHNNASNLVKQARQPTSLALNSVLASQPVAKKESDGDVIHQLTAVASSAVSKFKQNGIASWYGRQFHGKPTASGETFDMNALTAAHSSLPMNCYIKVTNKDNGKSVVVRVNDRPQSSRTLDLSYGAAQRIDLKDISNVVIERVDNP
ncbi:septal ring lytic transglycosylase RlpA family protein [Moraxella oblonga]|uniref:septal ring lytic transglycosylase RlpA family protein n=1 Tax=Moraxella oblonga TaxID=200413 RepID=UPI00082B64C7|nr:septal ring lytic transglycosylase RlpA family protein [Moraxella oblonga]